jgi:GGDEF domain-containing protein
MDTSTTKDKLARFGRTLALLLNRSLMYQKSHPIVQQSIEDVFKMSELLFHTISPVVFILNREQFYVDEEQLDPRVNVKRIAHVFQTHGIQSISFEPGLTVSEIDIFIDIFSSMTATTSADTVKKELLRRGAYSLRVNHVLYKKVTEDDQVVSREALKQVTPSMEDDDSESRKKFMDTLLESILTDEFTNTLNIKNLLDNPGQVSKNMIEADLASVEKFGEQNITGLAGGVGMAGLDPGTGGQAGSGGTGTGSRTGIEPAGAGTGAAAIAADSGGPETGGGGSLPGSGPGGGTGGDPATGGLGAPGLSGTGSGSGTGDNDGAAGTHETMGFAGDSAAPSVQGVGSGESAGGAQPAGTAIPESKDARPGLPASTATARAKGGTNHGHMLLHQLDLMQQEVRKHLEGGGDFSLEALADAVFEMKKQLFEDIQTQKALGIAYANEDAIVDNVNDLTDQVIIELIREEYDDGNITTQRFAQIILRLIPDAKDLKRLLPKIKATLLDCGMTPEDYLDLVDELKHVLENEELSRILEESSEAIGIDKEELIEELKGNSGQAAKLIYLASEIRKGGGDESALADILVEYVEQMTNQAVKDTENGGEEHLKSVISDVESTVLGQLSKLDVGKDVLLRLEERVNARMDSILDRLRVDWIQTHATPKREPKTKPLTVFQTIEHNVGDDEEMAEILKAIRAKVDGGEIEENNFSQIHTEINLRKKQLAVLAEGEDIPEGVLSSNEVMFILEKEIARANRYSSPFSALAFSFVDAKPKIKALENLVTTEAVMAAVLDKLFATLRDGDYIGQIAHNKMVALLPMQSLDQAKLALGRVLNILHREPLMVKEVPVKLRVAGVAAAFDADQTPEAHIFAKKLSNQLMDMVSRIKNIRVLF